MTISIKSRYTDALSARKIQESDFIDYFHHYDDDICRVLKSTKFKLYKDFKKWITKQLQDRHIYILENQKLGFIGSFGYEVFSELAYIHYWVSKKYQGLGYGLYLINFLKNKAPNFYQVRGFITQFFLCSSSLKL